MRWLSRHAKLLLGVYSAFLAVALFSPASTEQSGGVSWVCQRLWAVGLPDTLVTFTRMEVLANVVIVAPVAFVGSFVWRSLSWRDWTAYGFAAALCIELVQGLLLPDRAASFSDVVANTAGAGVGAWLVWLHRRDRRRPHRRGPAARARGRRGSPQPYLEG